MCAFTTGMKGTPRISMVIHSQILNRAQIQGIICTGYKNGPCLMVPSKRLRSRKKLMFDHVLVWVRQNYGSISLLLSGNNWEKMSASTNTVSHNHLPHLNLIKISALDRTITVINYGVSNLCPKRQATKRCPFKLEIKSVFLFLEMHWEQADLSYS